MPGLAVLPLTRLLTAMAPSHRSPQHGGAILPCLAPLPADSGAASLAGAEPFSPGKWGCPTGVRSSAQRGMLPPLGWEGWEGGAHCFCWESQCAGSKVSVASQEQSRHVQLTAESSPVRTITPKNPSCLPINISPWTLQLQFYLPCLFPLNSMSLERERETTGKKRRISRKGMWVRTRESGGGLSKGSKGGLLHSQLVELGQLLRGRRDIRAKKVIVIEYKSHRKSRTKL